jgi:hypothetical protein
MRKVFIGLLWLLTGLFTTGSLNAQRITPTVRTEGISLTKPPVATTGGKISVNRDAIYSEDFESVPTTTLPQGWITTATPADDIWLAGTVLSSSAPLPGHSGSKYAYLLYNESTVHDSWAFSPAIELTAGISYNISFWVQLRAYQNVFEALEVKIGTEATAAGMTILIYDENDANITAWQEVFYQFTPATSGTYYIGFHSYSPANSNATMVDDVRVETTPGGPSFDGASGVAFGNIYDIMPNKQAAYTVRNTGAEPLTVSQTSASPEITLAGASQTIAPGKAATVTVTLSDIAAGSYTGSFELSTNDPSNQTVTVNVTATVLTGTLTESHYQDFESGAPAGWTTTGFMPHAGSGIGGSASYRAAVAGYQPQFMTHFVEMGADPIVNFSYKAINLTGQNVPTPANGLALLVFVSDDYGVSFTEVYRIEPGGANEHIPSLDYAEVNIPLSAYAGKTCMIGAVSAGAGGTMYYMHIDNMRIGSKAADDLTALSISGSTMPSVNAASVYTVTVENAGFNTQTSYTVRLMREGIEEIASLPGVSIAAGETKTFELEWTPAAEGAAYLYGEVLLEGDLNTENNRTENHNVTVQPEGVTVVTVGTGKSLYYSPVNFYYKENASQALYFANEIGTNGGTIDRIMYQTAFNAPFTSKPFKIWIGETDRTDFADLSWVDVSELTPVFDGVLSQPAGDANWQIQFDEPFEYHGGNIVVYAVKIDTESSVGKYFYSTLEPGANRIIVSASDNSGTITEENPGAGQVALSNAYPNLFFFMNIDDTGSVSGVVSGADGPLGGVKIEVAGTMLYAITSAEGEYEFASLVPGTYTLKATLFGHDDETASATVTADNNTAVDFTMTETVEVTIDGTVTRTDNGTPVEGAKVTLSGYENYETVTDAEGIYTIEGIYGNHEYEVAVTATGFVKYTATIAVAEENITRNIEMNEIPAPVQMLVAEENAGKTAVEVKWYEPETFTEFRYDRGTIDSKLGLDKVYPNGLIGAVHRVPAVLNEMSWYLSDEISGGAPHEMVDLYILDLNSEGLPTSTVLYSATGVVNTDAAWNLHTFPEPVNAPNGFMLAIGYPYGTGFLGLGLTNPDEEYPFVNNTQYFSSDYINGEFISLELAELYANFMIRALGTVTGEATPVLFNGNRTRRASAEALRYSASTPVETGAPAYSLMSSTPKAFVNYSVYRLLEGQEQNEAEWDVLTETLTDTVYTDNQWATLNAGVYRYAAKANYTNLQSVVAISKPIAKNMIAEVTVNLTTNSGDPINGATVKLTHHDGNIDHVYTQTANSSTAVFAEVWKGTYNLTVMQQGFEPYSEEAAVDSNNKTFDVELAEAIETPFGLLVEPTNNPADWIFSWDNMVAVTLEAGNIWGDGTGYQLLLDASAVLYGTTIPTTGALAACGAPVSYDIFSHRIPENADPECTTGNIVVNSSITIMIPPGTYDLCIVNPSYNADPRYSYLYIAAGENGRKDNFAFEAGRKYNL